MTALVITLASVVAVAAAIRSTWSPCGLSMLSTITPLGEQARGYRWGASTAWFVAGAVLGGATLALGAAALAAAVAALDPSTTALVGAAAVLAAITLASDLQLGGFRLPAHARQVNETWLDQFRSWVYAGGFGWQIGVGLATYVTTSAVYLMVALAALTASPLAAFAIVTGFGLVRGLAVLLGKGLTTPQKMMALHRRLEELLPAAQRGVVAAQALVMAVAAGAAWGPVPAAALAAVGATSVLARRPRPAQRPSATVPA
ncbi:MAG: hypothetical protein ACLGI8_04025 [Acidimicrobiia bacterium]